MKILSTLAFLLLSLPALSAENSSISVNGTGSIRVIPDQVSVTVGFVARDKQAQIVKAASDKTMRAIIEAAKKLKIAEKDIQTDFAQIDLENEFNNQGGQPKNFVARRSLRVLLRDVKQFDSLTAALFQAGANNLASVDFSHSKEEEYRARSRVLAVRNAKDTAEQLAKEAGLKLGVAKIINLGVSNREYALYAGGSAKMAMDAPSSRGPSISQGEIEITTELAVTYEAK